MDWLNVLDQIFDVCIVPLLGVLTSVLIAFINSKSKEAKEKTQSELGKKYLDMLDDTIIACIKATNQTYVEALKEKNAFDAEAQKVALTLTFDSVKAILSEEAKQYLNHFIGDLDVLIKEKIEANIKAVKAE